MSTGAWAQLDNGQHDIGVATGKGATSPKAPPAYGPDDIVMSQSGADARKSSLMTYPSEVSTPSIGNPTLPSFASHDQSQKPTIDFNVRGGQFWHNSGLQRGEHHLSPAQAELWEAWRNVPVSNTSSEGAGSAYIYGDPPPTPPSSSSSSSDDESYDPDPKDFYSSDDSGESRKSKKKKPKGKKSSKDQIRRKMQKHISKFQSIRQGFDDKVLEKNPMDVVGAIYNLRLQTDKDTVAYAKRAGGAIVFNK